MSVHNIYSPNIYQHMQQIIQQELSLDPPQGLLAELIDRIYSGSNHVERLISPDRAASMFLAAYIDPNKEYCGLDTATISTPRRRKISLSDYEIMDHENPSPTGGHEVITALTGQLEVCGQRFWTQGVGDGLTGCLNEVLHSVGLVIKVLEYKNAVIEFDAATKLGKDKYTSDKAVVTYVKCSDVTSCTAWGIGIGESK